MSPNRNEPAAAVAHLFEYIVDAGPRSVLFCDVMRERGNQYHEHMAQLARTC